MDVDRLKNIITLAVLNMLPMRFFVWALHVSACQVGNGMKERRVSPIMDPYEMRLYDILLIHAGSVKGFNVDPEWLRGKARETLGGSFVEINEEASADRLLTILQQNQEFHKYFNTEN